MNALDISLGKKTNLLDENVERVHRMAGGDESALCELYKIFGQHLFAFALRLTGSPALAEDVIQDSLIAAWQNSHRFRGESRVITWLLGIVHHKALNAIRKRTDLALDDNQRHPWSRLPSLDEQVIQREWGKQVRDGIAGLSLEHRMVLDLVFYQGLSLEETAQVCHIPVGTVKSRLNYAKENLRGILSRLGISKEDMG